MLHPLRILGRWNASLVEGACERDEDAAFDLELADNPDEAASSRASPPSRQTRPLRNA